MAKEKFTDPALASGVDPLGQFVGTGKESVNDGTLFSGDADPTTGQRQERFVKSPDTFVPKAPVLSGGTDKQRDELMSNKDNIGGLLGDLDKSTDLPTGSVLKDLQSSRDRINTTTSDELKLIKEAGEDAGAAFDSQIESAEESRKRELATGIVRAGEAGGFESTQLAGTAAVLPTDPATGEAFVGAGGRLSQQRQLLDRNISFIKAEQQRAIQAARSAQRKYLKDGKREDFNDAVSLAKLANDFAQDAENLKIKKEQAETSKAAEFRQGVTAEFNIVKNISEGETVNIGGVDFVGIKIPDSEKAFFSGSNIISLMGQLEEGETLELPPDPVTGSIWTVEGQKDPATTQAIDDNGNLSIINKKTGEVISKAANVGKSKTAPISVNIRRETGALITGISDSLEADKGEDGKVNPATYGQKQREFIVGQGGTADDFKRMFPPEEFLNSNNPDTIQFFQTPKDVLKGEGDDGPLFE